jgi:hypothetical protein
VEVKPTPLVYRGAKEISAVTGISWKRFRHYVDDLDLPAFRIDGVGTWLALHADLAKWIKEQRDKYRGQAGSES